MPDQSQKKVPRDKFTDLNQRLKEVKLKNHEKKFLLKQKLKPVLKVKNLGDYKTISKANKTPKGRVNYPNTPGYILEVFKLNKYYANGKNTYHALKNVSFKIKKGEFVSIVGASGSGKTTLLNVISGLDRATEGDVVVNNTNISALPSGSLTTFRRNNVGFIFQSYNLLPELSAIDNVSIGTKLQTDGTKRIPGEELLASMNLLKFKDTNVQKLSGGQQQRVSVARAISKNPHILFADEPTGALDSRNSLKIMEIFRQINQKYGTTIVLVTHNVEHQKLTDRSVFVSDGIVED